ncbi:MAG TPA: copper homeostasis protein CutC [Flexivirga sp.]|uniref:copper homeostasis protein CutC n=1 Tax=Flexivirga sp. TaxID=1962927 RepID=UPI002C00199C|nr:copper homeostasis protein CutC [Flexivirga sp.]HWC23189.1 copper homeostasis protein CutC [Flexivirga sp.]
MSRTLEVIVTSVTDARAAHDGGADRLELVAEPERGGMTPAPDVVRAVLAATDLPVRVMIRRAESHRLTDEDAAQLCRDVESLPMATGFVCGAVDVAGVPSDALGPVIAAFGGRHWTFHRALDDAPDLAAAVTAALFLPGCDQVLTAGDPAGIDVGMPRIVATLRDPELAAATLVGGGVTYDNLPALLAAGARGIHLGRMARVDGSWDHPVQSALVRAAADLVHGH